MVSVCLPSDALLQHLPSHLGFSYLGRGVSLHGCSSKAQLLLLTLDEVTPPDLLSAAPSALQPGTLGRCPCPWAWGSSSRPRFCEVHHSCHSQSDHTDHSLVKLNETETKPCCVGPPKTDGSWWRGLTECGPLEKGMANLFSSLALRTP